MNKRIDTAACVPRTYGWISAFGTGILLTGCAEEGKVEEVNLGWRSAETTQPATDSEFQKRAIGTVKSTCPLLEFQSGCKYFSPTGAFNAQSVQRSEVSPQAYGLPAKPG